MTPNIPTINTGTKTDGPVPQGCGSDDPEEARQNLISVLRSLQSVEAYRLIPKGGIFLFRDRQLGAVGQGHLEAAYIADIQRIDKNPQSR